MRGKIFPEAYSPACHASARATEFEGRVSPNEGGLVAVGERPGQLFRETEPGKTG